ncbi:YceI family protein [Flavobacterium sp. 5]|uniref:YceI family protein n=1 Tax=Flavobacterium sp. 5 TaxID=2035199 RepID=UPI000C2C7BEF|nr:YceI family protein [Flavobacterium sp. 5]PKB16653.1 YceI-like domain-containing protein [Flavobacterium sp. 5]
MKKNILIVMLSIGSICFSQEKIIDKSGTITFEASVPSFEEVKATNNSVTFVLNPQTGEIASLALMKGFQFKIALMEEHFNENFIESDQYPKAIFKGKINGFDVNSLTANPKDFTIKGTLELHGKSKDIIATAKISKTSLVIKILANFSTNASDFNISIPAVIKNKLTNKVNVQISTVFKYNETKQ